MPVNNRDRELRKARREESQKWFQECQQRWEKVQGSSEASQIIASLYAKLSQNPRRHESTSESIAAKHFSGFVSEPAFELIKTYAKAYSNWVFYLVGFDDDGDVDQTHIEDTEVNYLNTVENAFYFSTPSFTDLLCLPHRWARQKFYKLLNRNVSNLKRRQKASLTRELSSSQWQRMKVEQIAGLPFDYPDICDQRKEYRNKLNRDSLFSGSKWHCLLDSVAFAFPQLHGGEGTVLAGFRVFVTTTRDVAPGEFAVDMNPEVAQIRAGELTLSGLENQTLYWGDIYNDLCALLAASQKAVLKRSDVIAAVFGSYYYADQKRVPNLHRHLCDRQKKLRKIFSCDQNPKHASPQRGDCRCELGWVPLSEELLNEVENINPLVVPQGGLSLPAGGSSNARGDIIIPVQDTNNQSFIDEDEKKSGDQL